MNKKDILLLEDAYSLVSLNEGLIPSFILNKLKSFLSNVVSKAKEDQPEEFDNLISVLQSKDINALKQLFKQYNVEAEVKKLTGIQNESYLTEGILSSAGRMFENILIKLADTFIGKMGTKRSWITLILILIMVFAHKILLVQGAFNALEFKTLGAGPSLMDFLTTTGVEYLSKAIYFILPLLVGVDRSMTRDQESREARSV